MVISDRTKGCCSNDLNEPRTLTMTNLLNLTHTTRQWRNGHNRYTELRRLGIAKFAASVAAGSPTGLWRMSGHPAVQHALRNHVFDSLGLPRIFMPVQA